MIRSKLSLCGVFMIALSALASANPLEDFATPARSFDGTAEELRRMSEECSAVQQTQNNAAVLRTCSVGCFQLMRRINEGAERPLTGQLASVCLNAYDAVSPGPVPEPPPPNEIRTGAVQDISGSGYIARKGGSIYPFTFAEDGIGYVRVGVRDSPAEFREICGRASVALRRDALSEEEFDRLMTTQQFRLSGISFEHTVDAVSGDIIRKRCKATAIKF